MIQDVNLFVAQMVFKYNLTTAVQESNIIVHDKSWVQSLKNAEEDESLIRQEISKALNPITEELMKVPAEEFVQTMSDDIVHWISDTAIAFAKVEGIEVENEELDSDITICEPEIKFIPIRVEIEKCSSNGACLCPDPIININECDIVWNDDGGFYDTNNQPAFDEPVYNYDYDSNIHDSEFFENSESEISNYEFDSDYLNSDYGDSYWYDESSWEYIDENGDAYSDLDF